MLSSHLLFQGLDFLSRILGVEHVISVLLKLRDEDRGRSVVVVVSDTASAVSHAEGKDLLLDSAAEISGVGMPQ